MDCIENIQKINMLIDGELPENEKEELCAHITVCESCRRRFRQYSAIARETAALSEDVPQELHERVMRVVSKKSRPMIFIVRRAAGVAAACALLVVAVHFSHLPVADMFYAKSAAPESPQATEYYPNADAPMQLMDKNDCLIVNQTARGGEDCEKSVPEQYAGSRTYNGVGKIPEYFAEADILQSGGGETHICVPAETLAEAEAALTEAGFVLSESEELGKSGAYLLIIKGEKK